MYKNVNSKAVHHSTLFLIFLLVCLLARDLHAAGQWQSRSDGTVADLATGLIWQQQSDGVFRNFLESLNYCAGLTLGGNSNWRVPDVKELISIVDIRVHDPSIDSRVFPNTRTQYWSSIREADNTFSAWGVDFFDGRTFVLYLFSSADVRCVR